MFLEFHDFLYERINMTIEEAVRKRINDLLNEKKISICAVSLDGGLTPSTLYDFMHGKSKHLQINTIKQICMGFRITLKEFFDKEYFNDYE